MDEPLKLPELPETITDEREGYFAGDKDFTAEQLRTHGQACARAALEEAAKVCEKIGEPMTVCGPGPYDCGAIDCADAIRKLKVGE